MQIVLGVDGSQASRMAIELVSAVAWPRGTSIRVVTAVEGRAGLDHGSAPSSADAAIADEKTLQDGVDLLAEPLRRQGRGLESVVTRGRAADALLAEAEASAADLIVVGSRGLGVVESALLGSVSAAVVDQAPCPVLVAKRPSVSRILIATDGSRSAEAIPAVLGAWNTFHGIPIDVLAVGSSSAPQRSSPALSWMIGGERRSLDATHDIDRHHVIAGDMADRLGRAGWPARAIVRQGDPAREIETAAGELGADLIVTGSRGLSGLQRLLLGSVAHHVLLHTDRSVLVMRGHVASREHRRDPVAAPSTA